MKDYLKFKIKDIIIHNIPLMRNNTMTTIKTIGKILSPYFHSAFQLTFSHIAIQLNIENTKDVFVIEYGQYYSDKSDFKKVFFLLLNLLKNLEKVVMIMNIIILIKMGQE